MLEQCLYFVYLQLLPDGILYIYSCYQTLEQCLYFVYLQLLPDARAVFVFCIFTVVTRC